MILEIEQKKRYIIVKNLCVLHNEFAVFYISVICRNEKFRPVSYVSLIFINRNISTIFNTVNFYIVMRAHFNYFWALIIIYAVYNFPSENKVEYEISYTVSKFLHYTKSLFVTLNCYFNSRQLELWKPISIRISFEKMSVDNKNYLFQLK